MIETLVEYKIHPAVVDLIARVYSEDRTVLTLGDMEREIRVNSGIKQECPLSTTLFKLVTFQIIKRLEKEGVRYDVEGRDCSSLFFADDSMLFAKTKEDTEKNLRIMTEVAMEYGLEINKEKSKVMVYGAGEDHDMVGGIGVVKSMKYLGLMIDDDKDIFKTQKGKMVKELEKFENMTFSIISKCCNKILIGKTYWKGMVLPSVLNGVGVINVNYELVGKIQDTENGVYRKILGARDKTVRETLRGEVGASSSEVRFMQSRLMLAKGMWNGKNKLVRDVMERVRKDGGNQWNMKLNEYLVKINVSFEDLVEMDKREIKKKLNEYDSKKWKEGIERKRSVRMYRRFKKDIKEEKVYDNRRSSQILFQSRVNCMALNNRYRHIRDGVTTCDLCKDGTEDLEHFLLSCVSLSSARDEIIINRNRSVDVEEWMGNILWKEKEVERMKCMIGKMWQKRCVERKRMGISER